MQRPPRDLLMRLTARFLAVCAALTAVGAGAALANGCVSPSCMETATCPDSPDSEPTDTTVAETEMNAPAQDASVDASDGSPTDANEEDVVEDDSADAADVVEAGPFPCTCTARPNLGWEGPGIIYETQGETDASACTQAPYTDPNFQNFGAMPSVPSLDCACQCGPPDGAACTPPSISVYSDPNCQNTCGSGGPTACTAAAAHCSSGGQSAAVTALAAPTGLGTCGSYVQTKATPPPTFGFYGEGCLSASAFSTTGCGDSGLVCAADPPSGSIPHLCIWTAEATGCPDSGPYQTPYRTYYAGFQDGRTCNGTQCGCGSPTGVSCTLVGAAIYSSAGCASAPISLSHLGLLDGSATCNSFPAGGIESMTTNVMVDGGCAITGMATTFGTATPDPTQGVETVCCAQ